MSDDLEDRLSNLEEEMDTQREKLEAQEQEIQQLKREKEQLRKENQQLKEERERLRDKVDDLENTVSELVETQLSKKEVQQIRSQLDAMKNIVQNLNEDFKEHKQKIHQDISDLQKRITPIETHIDMDEKGPIINSNASTIEQLSLMPQSMVEDVNPKKTVRRSVTVWENFDDWSRNTSAGRRLTSTELRSYINAKNDIDLSLTEVYRVMKAFDRNTPRKYQYVKHDDFGKALVKFHDTKYIENSSPELEIIETGESDNLNL